MKKVVLDTNVVISALLFGGQAQPLVHMWKGSIRWIASAAVIREYVQVLSYPKFKLPEEDIRYLLEEEILPFITPITVKAVPNVPGIDLGDRQLLACAVAGKADCIVTGDAAVLALKEFKRIPVLSLAEFLKKTRDRN